MTLVIAIILMNHIGGFESGSYIGVWLLWIAHLFYHGSGSSK